MTFIVRTITTTPSTYTLAGIHVDIGVVGVEGVTTFAIIEMEKTFRSSTDTKLAHYSNPSATALLTIIVLMR